MKLENIEALIYQANIIGSDEKIEGSYISGIRSIIPNDIDFNVVDGSLHLYVDVFRKMKSIDIETLKISFDGGSTWNSIDIVASALKFVEALDSYIMENYEIELPTFRAFRLDVTLMNELEIIGTIQKNTELLEVSDEQ